MIAFQIFSHLIHFDDDGHTAAVEKQNCVGLLFLHRREGVDEESDQYAESVMALISIKSYKFPSWVCAGIPFISVHVTAEGSQWQEGRGAL